MTSDNIIEQSNPKPVIARQKGKLGAVMIDPKTGKPIPGTWIPKEKVPQTALKYLDPEKFSAAERRNANRQAQIDAEKQRLKNVGNPPASTPPPPTSTTKSTPASAPASTPSSTKTAPTSTPSKPISSASASTAEKIKGGSEVYKRQIKMGDIKGAEATGKATWALANPKLAAAAAERERTRGTSSTTNPQMAGLKDRLPAAKTIPSATSTPPPKVKTDTAVERTQSVSQPAIKSIEAEVKKKNIPTFNTSKMTTTLKQSYEYDAYDLVLEYLLSTGHAETVIEAAYIMMEMDTEFIQSIVENVEKGPILPGEKGKRVYPKGQEPKPTGAKLPPV